VRLSGPTVPELPNGAKSAGGQREPGSSLVPLPELDEHGRAAFSHRGRAYAVFSLDGELVVTDGACPHKGGPLAEGLLRDGAVVCPWHWYTFDLATGQCRTASEVALRRHPVVLVDGRPHVRLTPPVTRSWAEVLRAHARGTH
jgi:nitrite reductase (NADH) small subunit